MPLYEYQCDACAHRFEVIQKYSDAPIGECPKCGGAVKKLFSSPAIQFKGSGFYITDYAKQGSRDSKDSKGSRGSNPGKPRVVVPVPRIPADRLLPGIVRAAMV